MFKKTALYTLIGSISMLSLSSTAQACTRVLWDTQNQGTFVARTMDWSESTQPTLVNFPSGNKYKTHLSKDHQVTSKYAVTGITAYGILMDGVNANGLGGNVLYDANMTLADSDPNNPVQEGAITYLRHLLSQYKNVNEAVKAIQRNAPVSEEIGGIPARIALHISLQDSTGDSAIIEWRDGKPNVWHGKKYTVLTNQPDYDTHLDNAKRLKPTWGTKTTQTGMTKLGTGGNANPEDRFIHSTYFSGHLTPPTSVLNGILKLDSTLFKIPHDAPNKEVNGVMTGYATEYTVIRHLQSGETVMRYQWGDTFHQIQYNTKTIQAANKAINFNVAQPNLAGNVTAQIIAS